MTLHPTFVNVTRTFFDGHRKRTLVVRMMSVRKPWASGRERRDAD